MNEAKHIVGCFPKGHIGRFLCLGDFPSVTEDLFSAGWEGLIVDHRAEAFPLGRNTTEKAKYLHGPIQSDPHYIQVGQNVWMRGMTLREVLDNFPGPFDALIVNLPSIGRDIVCSDATWAFWPKVIAVVAEGREQEITNQTAEHSYTVKRIERDAMILVRPDFDK